MELDIYKNRDSCGGQMDKLLNRAEKKVREVDVRIVQYVGALSTGGNIAREQNDCVVGAG